MAAVGEQRAVAVPVEEVGEQRAVVQEAGGSRAVAMKVEAEATAVEMAEMKVAGMVLAAKEMQLPELGVEEGMAAVRVARIG